MRRHRCVPPSSSTRTSWLGQQLRPRRLRLAGRHRLGHHLRPGSVSTRHPSPVTTTVCSKCADRAPSFVTAVQPSASTFTAGLPAFTIGSIASDHALRQPRTASRGPVVRNLRLLVQRRADAVADELADHRKPLRLDVLLHRGADVRHPGAGPHHATARSSAALVTVSSRCASGVTAPDRHRHRRVAVEPVELGAHVDRDDVALDQRRGRSGCRARPARSPTRKSSPDSRGSP